MFKKIITAILGISLILGLTSCGYSEKKQEKVAAMFDSFPKMQQSIILTNHKLVIGDKHYDLSEIKYEGKECNILFLEETGFYSYTYNQEDLSVQFLFTKYENFENTLLGTDTLPSKIINDFWGNNCFWFRMDDPATEEFKQMYYTWNIETQQTAIINSEEVSDNYEYSADNNRSPQFSFQRNDKMFNDSLDITDNNTNTTKRIDKSILKTFDEGKQIKKNALEPGFDISHVFEKDGDIYFISYYGVEAWGDPCYYYVVKWNFEKETCELYAYIYFDQFQDWIVDMYII